MMPSDGTVLGNDAGKLVKAPAPAPLHVMVDLETLGTEAGCAVVAIGAVHFGLEGPGPVIRSTFERRISVASNARAGLFIDGKTLEWWLSQDAEAITATFGGERVDVWSALKDFTRWVRELGAPDVPLLLWAKPPSFDQTILEAACQHVGVPTPWSHRDWRDLRTLEFLAAQVGFDMPDTVARVKHSALEDASAQAYNAAKRILYVRSRAPQS